MDGANAAHHRMDESDSPLNASFRLKEKAAYLILGRMEKSFSRRVAEGVLWSSFLSGLQRVVGLGLTFLILKQLGLIEYGIYQLVLAAWGLMAVVMLTSLDKLVIAGGSRTLGEGNHEQTRHIGQTLFLFKFIAGVGVWAIVYFGSTFLHRWYAGDIISYLRILSWTFLVMPFSAIILYDLSVHQRFFLLNLYPVLEDTVKLVWIAVLFFIFHARIDGALWALTGASVFVTVVFFPVVASRYLYRISFRDTRHFFALLFSQGKWLLLQKQVRQFDRSIRPFIIKFFLGTDAVALFSVAEKVILQLVSMVPISDVLVPSVSREMSNHERQRRVLEKGIKYSVPFFALVAIAAAILVRPLFRLFFPQFLPALPLIDIVLLYLPISGVAAVISSFYYSHREQKTDFLLSLFRFGFFLVTFSSMLRFMGPKGVAVEFVLGMVIYLGLKLWLLVRAHPELRGDWRGFWKIDSYDREVWRKVRLRLPWTR